MKQLVGGMFLFFWIPKERSVIFSLTSSSRTRHFRRLVSKRDPLSLFNMRKFCGGKRGTPTHACSFPPIYKPITCRFVVIALKIMQDRKYMKTPPNVCLDLHVDDFWSLVLAGLLFFFLLLLMKLEVHLRHGVTIKFTCEISIWHVVTKYYSK